MHNLCHLLKGVASCCHSNQSIPFCDGYTSVGSCTKTSRTKRKNS